MRQELIIANEGGMRMQGIMFIPVTDKHRLQRDLCLHGSTKELVEKPFQTMTICRCAFRKEQDIAAFAQMPRQLVRHLSGITSPTLDKQCSGNPGEPANHRPPGHFCLGQEIHREVGPEYRNIKPGNMIGNPQCMPIRRDSVHTDIQIEDIAETPVPPSNDWLLPGTVLDKRSTTHHRQNSTLQQVYTEAKTPVIQPDPDID